MSVTASQLFVAVDRGSGRWVILCQWVTLGSGLLWVSVSVYTGQLYIAMPIIQVNGDRLWPWCGQL